MTDKELLELAAKAADYGFTYKRKISNDAHEWTSPDEMIWQWNPLMDDGQALRLAVKLKLNILISSKTTVKCAKPNNVLAVEERDDDQYAATRKAIVRAAAEIGKTL